jgi:hypothetical protein
MRHEFPEIGVVDYSANYENAGAGEEPRRRTWSAPAFTHTVGGICRRCNNGWMSHLEAVAKPVLLGPMKGRRARWSSTEQQTVATWAVKTVLVAALATAKLPDGVVPSGFYRQFGSEPSRLPPRVVWVGRYDTEGQFPTALHMAGALLLRADAPPPGHPEPSNAFHATMVVGALAFRVVGHDLLGADIGEPRPARSWSRIEPTPGPVRWPPPETMGQADLVEAVETFPGDDGWMNNRLTVT